MRTMGIDYGDKRVGIALSDPLGITAQGYGTLENTGGKKLFEQIVTVVKEKQVSQIVVGLPKNMDNSQGFRSEATHAFVERLKTYTDVPVTLWDERLTTVEAHGYLNEMDVRGKRRKAVVDTVAACLILENYLRGRG